MSDWTAGYVGDVGYTFGYYHEMNPRRYELAFLNAGVDYPRAGAACELGFGQGVSVNVHAAASSCNWFATDFNPGQVAFAKHLAEGSGADVGLYDEGFSDFCLRDDLPDFDFIGLHGIWTWIDDDNRRVIVDFVRRKLKVGGVLYISYNTFPGWADVAPLRHLMKEHADNFGVPGQGIVSRAGDAINFVERLMAVNPRFAKANPHVPERYRSSTNKDRLYVAHEFFNQHWHPMHFSDMKEWLSPAKMQFACTAHLQDHIPAINITEEQRAFLEQIPDAGFRESAADFMVNRQFRRDYWVKGARALTELEVVERFRDLRLLLVSHRPSVSLTTKGSRGEATMTAEIYEPFLDLLSEHRIMRVIELERALAKKGIGFAQLREAIVLMTGLGHVALVQEDHVIEQRKPFCDGLNQRLIANARGSGDVNYLASPVTGAGVVVTRFQQLFLRALFAGADTPSKWALSAWGVIAELGERVARDGKPVDKPEDNIAQLTEHAEEFAHKRLPILKALGIA